MSAIQEMAKKPSVTVQLEPVQHTRETLAKWTKWVNDPDIRQWMTGDLPKKPEDINSWLYFATHDPRRYYFSIIANGKQIGLVSLRQDQEPSNTAEIGIAIGEKDYQGRGIGSLTVQAVDAYAKEAIGLTSIRAMIKPTNEKSIRVFTKQGYVHTGDVTIDGEPSMKFEKQL